METEAKDFEASLSSQGKNDSGKDLDALSGDEREARRRLEAVIRRDVMSLRLRVTALLQIKKQRLYRPDTFEVYCAKKPLCMDWRSAYRQVWIAEIIERTSPIGEVLEAQEPEVCRESSSGSDALALFVKESHFRPLFGLPAKDQDEVIAVVNKWAELGEISAITAKVVASARSYLSEPEGPAEAPHNEFIEEFRDFLRLEQAKVSSRNRSLRTFVGRAEAWLNTKAHSGGTVKEWKLIEEEESRQGRKVQLVFDHIGNPLRERVPKRFEIEGMVFSSEVPTEFIEIIFAVMERANWHTFYVRGESTRAAHFLENRYPDKNLPSHIEFKLL